MKIDKIIDTEITEETFKKENRPQLKIKDKLYTVDNRQSIFRKISELQETITDENEKTKRIYTLALGESAANEILNMDLPLENAIYLSYCIMGAITGQDPKKLQEEARKN